MLQSCSHPVLVTSPFSLPLPTPTDSPSPPFTHKSYYYYYYKLFSKIFQGM